jgi:hypothetical protein
MANILTKKIENLQSSFLDHRFSFGYRFALKGRFGMVIEQRKKIENCKHSTNCFAANNDKTQCTPVFEKTTKAGPTDDGGGRW